eukprot:TRINITY_DN22437_c0_g1_i1.p2 TRINITY_DN22437_c0_g1~~TRINITY_DN22437_c0_g1_i1.p2  ORF type:complete len:226 (+),score=33.06 TRINITY_DN22437_c0_g1_i1:1023-1700(+)
MPRFSMEKACYHLSCVDLAARIIVNEFHLGNYFNDRNTCKQTILVFVPGYSEIFELMDVILSVCPSNDIVDELVMFPLHSSIPGEEQEQIFDEIPKHCRKIIIGTNIAESSVTIPDLSCVIDFCLTKESYFNKFTNSERLELTWTSKASCAQRAGRAGRLADGQVFRLISRDFFDQLFQYSTPEMHRIPLDKLILQIKTWDNLSLIHICRCRRYAVCRSRWSPDH